MPSVKEFQSSADSNSWVSHLTDREQDVVNLHKHALVPQQSVQFSGGAARSHCHDFALYALTAAPRSESCAQELCTD